MAQAPGRSAVLKIARLDSPYVGLRLVGEVDLSTRGAFELALAELAVGGDEETHLDLSDLTFIDVAGAAALVKHASKLGPGGRVVLHQPPPLLQRILEILWTQPPVALELAEHLEVSASAVPAHHARP